MAYRLKRTRPLGEEVRRRYRQQLSAAINGLAAAKHSDTAAHTSRKHIKKARALLDAVAGEAPVAEARWELTIANRALGVVSDAYRVIPVVADLRGVDRERAPGASLDRLRAALIARAAAIEQHASAADGHRKVIRLLVSARSRAESWDLGGVTPSTIIDAIANAHRRAKRSRRHAIDRPASASYHRWRKRTKAEWYLFRLVADHTGRRVVHDQNRLAALDACLGHLHDVDVLAAIIARERLLDREESARLLAVLRQYAHEQRRRARVLSVTLDDPRREVKRRMAAVWGMPAARPSSVESSCRHAA
ncbi:MAG TPA: CHAD domain-containing protein [Vicinamibacterales bacterium]